MKWVNAVLMGVFLSGICWAADYNLSVLPREDKTITDSETGATLLFLTSGKFKERSIYFHQRSWLWDSSLIIFHSNRDGACIMGYIVATGELVNITTEDGSPIGNPTAAVNRNSVFGTAAGKVVEIALKIEVSKRGKTRVTAKERVLCELAGVDTYLNESCDARYLAAGGGAIVDGEPGIKVIRESDGGIETLCEMPPGTIYHGHVQWSTTNPNWVSFAGEPNRLWVVDVRDRKPWCPYQEYPGELVTHESWWVKDQMIFCGGVHPKPTEDSHIKSLNVLTGQVKIIGEGAWWPGATSEELAKRNWWHASASPDGIWVAGDNWHGDIMLFEGLTTRPRLLTTGHRTYGKGEHPEVGWDRKGFQVIFGSQKLGYVAPCVATIPTAWQEDVRRLGKRLESTASK
jgi:hypothetical protein